VINRWLSILVLEKLRNNMATEQGVKILQYLEKHGSADSVHLAKEWNEPHQKIFGAVQSLLSSGNVSNIFIFLFCGNYLHFCDAINVGISLLP